MRCLLVRSGFWAAAAVMLITPPVGARILKTRSSPSSDWSPWSTIVVGSGLELQSNSQETEYDFPLLLEYNFSEQLKLSLEPNFVQIVATSRDARTVGGFGDLETSVEYEFLRERRYRPAISAQGLVKWPAATDPDLGTPGHDYSVGLIASKDLVYFDVDLNLLYTLVGDPAQSDNLQIALAVEYHLNRRFDIIAEAVTTIGGGGVRGLNGTFTGLGSATEGAGGGNETEGTVGVAWHASKYLKLEQGVTYKSDHSWQFAVAWEWSFSGN
jgi:hypothetical protein